MWLELDQNSGLSLSWQIYGRLKKLILKGDLAAGNRLPSSRSLSRELNLARNTVLEAYEQLIAEGYLETRPGSGTVVAAGLSIMENAVETAKCAPRPAESQVKENKEIINFRSGIPDLEAFPKKDWARLYQKVCGALPTAAFRYADPAGIWELREAVSAYLFRVRGIRVPARRVMICSGSTQGLWLFARLLYRPGLKALTEDPAHTGLLEVVKRAGYTLKGLPVDAQGLETETLNSLKPKDLERLAFIYTTPSHQYPLGGLMPAGRRQALIRFARKTGCLIVEDDYDSEFRYEGPPVGSLFELAPETVIYLGSFSKILAPALRLGFALIPENMIDVWRAEKNYTDVHTDSPSQYALAEFINSGALERHIWKMKKIYQRKRLHLMRCLSESFKDAFEIKGQATGLHLVAAFPGRSFGPEFLAECSGQGLKVGTVEQHSLAWDGSHSHELIMGYSHLSKTDIEEGVKRLKAGMGFNS